LIVPLSKGVIMKSIINLLDRWSAKAIRLIRPRHHKSSNVLTDNVHIKQLENDKGPWENESVSEPDHYQVTQTGQVIREPVKRKKYFYKQRYKSKKRT
jgi:hypothetical protein